jgi:hypothetical protein
VKLGDETHNITPKLHPKILKEAKIDPVRPWALKTITIPNSSLNLYFQKRPSQSTTLLQG